MRVSDYIKDALYCLKAASGLLRLLYVEEKPTALWEEMSYIKHIQGNRFLIVALKHFLQNAAINH
ncbi:hypothetical protein SCA6_009106 [Theobroma cacao]